MTTGQKTFAAAALMAGLMLGVGGAAAEGLIISNWDGYMAPDAVEGFTARTGYPAELVLHATNEEIMGKLAEASAFVEARLCGGCPVRGIRLMQF